VGTLRLSIVVWLLVFHVKVSIARDADPATLVHRTPPIGVKCGNRSLALVRLVPPGVVTVT
jgi:hypothetical protein